MRACLGLLFGFVLVGCAAVPEAWLVKSELPDNFLDQVQAAGLAWSEDTNLVCLQDHPGDLSRWTTLLEFYKRKNVALAEEIAHANDVYANESAVWQRTKLSWSDGPTIVESKEPIPTQWQDAPANPIAQPSGPHRGQVLLADLSIDAIVDGVLKVSLCGEWTTLILERLYPNLVLRHQTQSSSSSRIPRSRPE